MSETLILSLVSLAALILLPCVFLLAQDTLETLLASRAARRHELRMKRVELKLQRSRQGKPFCQSCGHGYGYHFEDGCGRTTEHPTMWNSHGIPVHYERKQCECLEYTGPVPEVTGTALRQLGSHG